MMKQMSPVQNDLSFWQTLLFAPMLVRETDMLSRHAGHVYELITRVHSCLAAALDGKRSCQNPNTDFSNGECLWTLFCPRHKSPMLSRLILPRTCRWQATQPSVRWAYLSRTQDPKAYRWRPSEGICWYELGLARAAVTSPATAIETLSGYTDWSFGETALQRLLFVTSALVPKRPVLISNWPYSEMPLQTECSEQSPIALSLHQECLYIECPYKENFLYFYMHQAEPWNLKSMLIITRRKSWADKRCLSWSVCQCKAQKVIETIMPSM